MQQSDFSSAAPHWLMGTFCAILTIALAFGLRMLEWPSWQNPEYRLGEQMLLATHDAYHWVAGAEGFGLAADHPMAVMLRHISSVLHVAPANAAFWIPAVLASLVAGILFFWAWALGAMEAGIAAGLIVSIAPGFLGRTLLGFYDTDLVTIFFPLLISLAPACWCMRFMLLPRVAMRKLADSSSRLPGIRHLFKFRKKKPPFAVKIHLGNPLAAIWIIVLAISGIAAYWTQSWHSFFPYLIRCNIIILACMAMILAPAGRRAQLLLGSLTYALPALAGLWGMAAPALILAAHFIGPFRRALRGWIALAILWLIVTWLLMSGDIISTIMNHANAYLKHAGDSHASGGVPLIFPSVAQSIIEVQDLSFAALFPYFHPWLEASAFGMLGFFLVILKRPGALFLTPLAALGLASAKLGGRMVMFGAPIVALGISLPIFWLVSFTLRKYRIRILSGWLSCILLCGLLVAPFMDMIPALSQGPIINRRHAAALSSAREITPPDATLWLWWDWGYAAHYFARRQTIADGARHGGPSLYLPAAVFATDNGRFARQVIRHTSAVGNEPGNFFKGMGPDLAQEMINRLRSAETPLMRGTGRQYVIVSFEMLKLGFWISNFGNWNFVTCQGGGGALSILPQGLAYKLSTGEVKLNGAADIIFPISINVFEETGLIRRDYAREWFAAHPKATAAEQQAWLRSRRNINFLFNRVTDEKLAVDAGIYDSLMVQLLVCDPKDPRFSPYFKLVYDNIFARIYEVLPAPADN